MLPIFALPQLSLQMRFLLLSASSIRAKLQMNSGSLPCTWSKSYIDPLLSVLKNTFLDLSLGPYCCGTNTCGWRSSLDIKFFLWSSSHFIYSVLVFSQKPLYYSPSETHPSHKKTAPFLCVYLVTFQFQFLIALYILECSVARMNFYLCRLLRKGSPLQLWQHICWWAQVFMDLTVSTVCLYIYP